MKGNKGIAKPKTPKKEYKSKRKALHFKKKMFK